MTAHDELIAAVDAVLLSDQGDWREMASAAGVTPSELAAGLKFFTEPDRIELEQYLTEYQQKIVATIERAATMVTPIPQFEECRNHLWSIPVCSSEQLLSAALEHATADAIVDPTAPERDYPVAEPPDDHSHVRSALAATEGLEYTGAARVKVRPLGDMILIKRIGDISMAASGIYLPEDAKVKPMQGEVIATGKGMVNKETGEHVPFEVKKGDHVIFGSYRGTEIRVDGEKFLIMTEENILDIID